MTRVGLYPGTFDPITFGHLDIIGKAATLVDRLIVAVATQSSKTPVFDLDERCDLIRTEVAALENGKIEIAAFDGLVVDYAESVGADFIIRGLRTVSDFDYEAQMAGMNARLKPQVQTVFLMADATHQFIAASLVRQIAKLGGNVDHFVPQTVAEALRRKFPA